MSAPRRTELSRRAAFVSVAGRAPDLFDLDRERPADPATGPVVIPGTESR